MVSHRDLLVRQKPGHQVIDLGRDKGCSRCPRYAATQLIRLYSCSCGLLKNVCMDCMGDHLLGEQRVFEEICENTSEVMKAAVGSQVTVVLLACQHWQIAHGTVAPGEQFSCQECGSSRTIVDTVQVRAKPYKAEVLNGHVVVKGTGKISAADAVEAGE